MLFSNSSTPPVSKKLACTMASSMKRLTANIVCTTKHPGSYHRRRLEILSEFIKQMNFGDCVDVFLSWQPRNIPIGEVAKPDTLLTWIGFAYHRLTTIFDAYYPMSYHLFPLPIISLCCLHLPYVYREPLESALIDRVLILDRPVRHTCIMEGDLDLSLLWSLCGGIFWVMQWFKI